MSRKEKQPWPSKRQAITEVRVHRYFMGLLREVQCHDCNWPNSKPGLKVALNYEEMVRHAEEQPSHSIYFHAVDSCLMTGQRVAAPEAGDFQRMAGIESATPCLVCGRPAPFAFGLTPGRLPACQQCADSAANRQSNSP